MQRPAHQLYKSASNCQAETCARLWTGIAHLFERLEYAAQVMLWHPHATVLDIETKPGASGFVSRLERSTVALRFLLL